MKKILFILVLIIISCSPKISSSITNIQPKFSTNENVIILTISDFQTIEGILVGEVSSTDNGLSTNCSYSETIAFLKNIARENGANIIEINSHKVPDKWSNCDRIKAHIYRVPNTKKYESSIEWSKNRKLTWNDFKGEVPENKINTLFAAETSSELKFQTNTAFSIKHIKYYVSNNFNCFLSWVKPELQNDYLLKHEQSHFDLTEIYSRILRIKLNNLQTKKSGFKAGTEQIFKEVFDLLNKKQEAYDRQTEHGLNEEKQKEWESYISLKLEELDLQL